MDVFRTSEEWTAIIFQSEYWTLYLSGNTHKYCSKAFALHFFPLSHCLFEGILQSSVRNYFRWHFHNFFFFLYRMEDKGEVKCIKFSLGNKILAVQRTLKSVVRNLHPADRELELEIFYLQDQSRSLWDKCSRGLVANNRCSENSSIILRGSTGNIVVLLVSSFKKKCGGSQVV